jgi:uncharacterized protein DUF2786
MEVNNAIIERIKKLLALANVDRSNTTPEEAANAAAAAQRLMAQHNIEAAMLDEKTGTESQAIGRDVWNADENGWKKSTVQMRWVPILAAAVAEAHFCKIVLVQESNSIWFCGTESNRAVAMYMFTYLRRLGDTIAREEYHERWKAGKVAKNHSELHRWRTGFFYGYSQALKARYNAMNATLRTEYANNPGALMVLNNALARVNVDKVFDGEKLKTGKQKPLHSHAEGAATGKRHGESVNLNSRGISSGTTRPTGRITDRSRLLK